MGKRIIALLSIVAAAVLVVPAVAFGANLVNEYGMNYAGQGACVGCHTDYDQQIHGRFATPGISPEAPAAWTAFQAAGDLPAVAGEGQSLYHSGGIYPYSLDWITLGDVDGNSGTEYLFFRGSDDPTVMPWNIVEGLVWEPGVGWELAAGAEDEGLLDESYSCYRCHQLGSTEPAADGQVVPNPAVAVPAAPDTAKQWARDPAYSVADFMSIPAASYDGLGIQCENCHGTGVEDSPGHMGSGAQIVTNLETLGQSQVCGQCHGSYSTVAGTLGIIGYTVNLPMRDFADINGGSPSYTKIPTEEEFLDPEMASKYYMYPNGSNARGNHYYYNEWAATGHSYRGALTAEDPDAMAFQAAGNGHFNAATSAIGCTKCHTGENYLVSKSAKIAEDFTPTDKNVGFMGQECITCHNGHPSAIGADDVVRDPDKAGWRSARGLSVDNASICEDCHNWQYEVLGGAPDYKPQADLSSRGGASHPQRETLHGRVMVDLPEAGEYMTDAACEDCHMPKTNRNANRISHGMKPMLPGKAEEWQAAAGYTKGEDSCSGCHTSRTRDQLQANIDGWQADTQAMADEAAAAILAAQALAPAEYSLTDPTTPGYALVGRATWNYKAFVNDGSTGVHNPEYLQAGLEKAVMMAKSVGGSFGTLQAPASLVPGKSGFVSGKVVNGDGSGAAHASLSLLANGVATGDTTMADAKGHFTFLVTPAAKTNYAAVWVRSGDPITEMTSASVSVAIAKVASSTGIKSSTYLMRKGQRIKLTGKVRPNAAGKTVRLQARKGGGSWRTIKTVRLTSSSRYSYRYKPSARATWSFRARYAGTSTVQGSTSRVVKVRVK